MLTQVEKGSVRDIAQLLLDKLHTVLSENRQILAPRTDVAAITIADQVLRQEIAWERLDLPELPFYSNDIRTSIKVDGVVDGHTIVETLIDPSGWLFHVTVEGGGILQRLPVPSCFLRVVDGDLHPPASPVRVVARIPDDTLPVDPNWRNRWLDMPQYCMDPSQGVLITVVDVGDQPL